jgi:hypothetical protein
MQEGDLEAEEPAPRPLVDQLRAGSGEPLKLRTDVVDLECNVVHAGPAFRDELPDRCLGSERGQQLDAADPNLHRGCLDALVGHRVPVLEHRSEQALVRLDRLVEIVDRHAEVVNVPHRHAGDANHSVDSPRTACKDQPVKLAWSAAVMAGALLATGCGSSGTTANSEATKTAAQILLDAQAAAANATSVHVSGSGAQGQTSLDLDLYLVAGKGARGHLKVNGVGFDIIRVGPTVYINGDATFWSTFGSGVTVDLVKGKWLSEPTAAGDFSSFVSLTDVSQLFAALLGSHGTLTKGTTSMVNGRPVIALTASSKRAVLYVSTSGPPYPIKLVNRKRKGTITFGQWNGSFALSRPAASIDINNLKALIGG